MCTAARSRWTRAADASSPIANGSSTKSGVSRRPSYRLDVWSADGRRGVLQARTDAVATCPDAPSTGRRGPAGEDADASGSALLGLVTAVGLGLVAFISQQGWPGVLDGPDPGCRRPSSAIAHNEAAAPVSQGSAGHRADSWPEIASERRNAGRRCRSRRHEAHRVAVNSPRRPPAHPSPADATVSADRVALPRVAAAGDLAVHSASAPAPSPAVPRKGKSDSPSKSKDARLQGRFRLRSKHRPANERRRSLRKDAGPFSPRRPATAARTRTTAQEITGDLARVLAGQSDKRRQ